MSNGKVERGALARPIIRIVIRRLSVLSKGARLEYACVTIPGGLTYLPFGLIFSLLSNHCVPIHRVLPRFKQL